MTGGGPPKLQSIQYLRGLAALAVVAFHATRTGVPPFQVGAAGVDVFFVISGFIMWVTTAQAGMTPGDFMARRLIRIAPLYWIVTLCTCAALFLKPHFFATYELTALKAVKSMLFVPVYEGELLRPALRQGWTLYYELFFYGLFAAALLAPVRIRAALVVGALGVLVALGALADPQRLVARTFTDPLLLEFGGGVALGWLLTSGRLPGARAGVAMAALGIAGFAVFAAHPGGERAVVWGVPALLLVAGAVIVEQRLAPRPMGWLAFLGDASYSVYLWHLLVIVALSAVIGPLGLGPYLNSAASFLVGAAVPLVLYLGIEKPMTERLGAAMRRRPRRLVAEGT